MSASVIAAARTLMALAAGLALVAGCASRGPANVVDAAGAERTSSASASQPPSAEASPLAVLARDDRLAVVRPGDHDTLRDIAARLLGDGSLDWTIAELNGIAEARPGEPVVVPLRPLNPTGVHADRYQTVPILCYHRFGDGPGRMTTHPQRFAEQLDWLADHGYHVVRLSDVADFLAGRRALPEHSVVLTFDDGYESVYRHAWPLLRLHAFPATIFLYTDFVGGHDALTWGQMAEMQASGLVEVQAHSKTHRNLLERPAGQTDLAYHQSLELETRVPREAIEARLGQPVDAYAYPFGSANETVVEVLEQERYAIGVTVTPGGNPFFAQPLLLRRTMVFGDDDLATFESRVRTSQPIVGMTRTR